MRVNFRPSVLITGLVISAVVLVQLASVHRQSEWLPGAVHLACGGVGALGFRRFAVKPHLAVWGVLAMALIAFVGHAVVRQIGWKGSTVEVQLIDALRNIMLGLAGVWPAGRFLGLVGLISLFLVIFSLLSVFQFTSIAVLLIYSCLGMSWLALGSRARWQAPRLMSNPGRRIRRWSTVGTLLGCGMLVVLLIPGQVRPVTVALRGLFPSSGGEGGADPWAHGGVGDGDQLVGARDRASSFGPVKSELYLESKMPSLYDAFNDQYSDIVPQRQKQSQRAIPLAPNLTQTNHQKKATTQKAGREFSAVRQRNSDRPAPPDLRSHALFYVSGRMPLHLKLEVFNTWDGTHLGYTEPERPEPPPLPLRLDQAAGLPWVVVRESAQLDDRWFGADEEHGVRVINLRTRTIPAPTHLTSFHIDQLHAANMFTRTGDGTIDFAGEYLPQMTMVDLRSRFPRANQLAAIDFQRVVGAEQSTANEERLCSSAVRKIRAHWVAGTAPGWGEIQAVCESLRSGYRLDRNCSVPADVEDAVEYFLTKSLAGPDYLFAVAAATLLRDLGYQTQVVSGFYARPENWERESRLTAVYRDDVHFWVEVATQDGTWVPIDPSPGYVVLTAKLSWREWAQQVVASVGNYCWQHATWLGSCWLLSGMIFVYRGWLIDSAATLWWWGTYRRQGARHALQRTLWLLEIRAGLKRHARLPGETVAAWCQRELTRGETMACGVSGRGAGERDPCQRFVAALQRALYGSTQESTDNSLTWKSSCRWAVSVYSSRNLKTRG